MNELYNILSIFVTSGVLLACGLMFLFTAIPDSQLLGNYRKARHTMAFAYLFFIPVNIVEYLSGDSGVSSIPLLQTVALAIAVFQALLFTFAMLALLEVRFPGWRYIFREVAIVMLYIITLFTVYIFCSESCFSMAFYAFAGIYALLLARYTCLFHKYYRRFCFRMDNYFSDHEAGRLRWVSFSFFAALAIGVIALFSALFMSTLVALLFTVVFDIFYIYFAIRFINYAHQFYIIERAMNGTAPEEAETAPLEETTAGSEITRTHDRPTFAVLEQKIEHWVAGKGFTEQGITIHSLATKLITNNKYLSTYINTYKKQTFREWMNELRIEEAKILLLQYPQMPLTEIASRAGFLDKSHFLRQFKKQTGISPTNWKNLMRER